MKFQVHLYYNSTACLYTTFIGTNPILKEGILLYDNSLVTYNFKEGGKH